MTLALLFLILALLCAAGSGGFPFTGGKR